MKKKKILSNPVLIFALMIGCAAASEKPAANAVSSRASVSKQRLEEDKLDFAAQDKEIAKCYELGNQDKEDEAFARVTRNVVFPLKLREESNNAEKAAQQLKKAIQCQKWLLKKRGKKLMVSARVLYAKGADKDAINQAGNAKTAPELSVDELKHLAPEVNDELKSIAKDADALIAKAQARLRREERANKVSAEVADPTLTARKKEIKLALAAAANLLKNNKLDEAREQIEKVYKLEPGNAEAADLASRLYYQFYKFGRMRANADAAGLMAYESWQWVEPTFQRNAASNDVPQGIVKTTSDQGVNSKLDKIVFPSVSFNETDIQGVMAFLQKNKNYDYPDKVGVKIDFDAGSSASYAQKPADTMNAEMATPDVAVDPGMAADPAAAASGFNIPKAADQLKKHRDISAIQVTLNAKNVTLRQLLDYLCFLTDLSYSVRNNRVVFGVTDNDMDSQNFPVMPSAVDLISQYGNGESASSADTAADAAAAETQTSGIKAGAGDSGTGETTGALKVGSTQKRVLSQDTLKKFFSIYGITFPEGSSINYNSSLGRIKMHNTEKNLRMLNDLLQELNEDKPMIQIEVKSIAITDTDMQELGFNWALGELGSTSSGGMWNAYMGENTTFSGNRSSQLSQLRDSLGTVLEEVTSPGYSNVITNLNIFPDLFGSFKPFGSDTEFNLSLTINALDRNSRTEMISAPKVLTSNNQRASVFLGKSYYFPTDWDELEVSTEGGDGDSGYSISVTVPNPTFGDSERIGTYFTVTPNVQSDNYTIRLNIKPTIKAYIGQDKYFMVLHYYSKHNNEKKKEEEGFPKTFSVWKPVIATQELDVQVDVYDGETLVLGGLVDSNSQSRLDKVPILGDLPLIGRLFQSHSEYSVRKNTLIFVTARLINKAGLPIRSIHSSGGIPEVNH